jgi:hypothetical protein
MRLYAANARGLLTVPPGASSTWASTKFAWFPPRISPIAGIAVNFLMSDSREAFNVAVFERMSSSPAGETADRANDAVGDETLYGAFAFVKIWIKGGAAMRKPSLDRQRVDIRSKA